jgi:hypothetical protein
LKRTCYEFSPSAGKFGEWVAPNDSDTYDKESEYDLNKFASSMNEISYF